MGPPGFEPGTTPLSAKRSTRLSYGPVVAVCACDVFIKVLSMEISGGTIWMKRTSHGISLLEDFFSLH